MTSSRRALRVTHNPESERPFRVISDPWDEGRPTTTIALTEQEAREVADYLNKHLN